MPRNPLLRRSPQRIGEILVRRGALTEAELASALEEQKGSGSRRVGEILKARGLVSEDELSRALAEQYGLEFVDLPQLPAGWTLARDLYTFKLKHLKILPLRDPAGTAWLLVSESTADEKLLLAADDLVELGRIRFGVAATSSLEQTLAEHPASNEPPEPPAPLPVLPEASGPAEAAELVPGMETLDATRALELVALLFGRSRRELERHAALSFARGPRFAVAVRQVVADGADLPPGYVKADAARTGRALDVAITLPFATRVGPPPERTWPAVWPPPDVAEALAPLVAGLCRVPPALRSAPDSLRWMGSNGPSRLELNHYTVQSMGVSVGQARIDTVSELWDAMLARARCLEANQAVRADWTRWKGAQADRLEILPGQVLALVALATGRRPRELAGSVDVRGEPGDVYTLELFRAGGAPTVLIRGA